MDSPNNTCIEDVRNKPEIGLFGRNINVHRNYFVHSITSASTRFSSPNSTAYSSYAISLIAKLEKFRNLKGNYDSYNADAPSPIAIDKAISLVKLADKKGLPLYFVAPGRNADILLEFNNKAGKVSELYFNQDGSIEQLHYTNEKCIYEGDYDFNSLEKFLNS